MAAMYVHTCKCIGLGCSHSCSVLQHYQQLTCRRATEVVSSARGPTWGLPPAQLHSRCCLLCTATNGSAPPSPVPAAAPHMQFGHWPAAAGRHALQTHAPEWHVPALRPAPRAYSALLPAQGEIIVSDRIFVTLPAHTHTWGQPHRCLSMHASPGPEWQQSCNNLLCTYAAQLACSHCPFLLQTCHPKPAASHSSPPAASCAAAHLPAPPPAAWHAQCAQA